MHQFGIDNGDIKASAVEQPSHWRMVVSSGLHDHAGFTVQAFEQPCQLAQFTVGVKHLKGRDYHLSKRTHDGNHASAFGNVNTNRVHGSTSYTNLQPESIFFSLPIQSIG